MAAKELDKAYSPKQYEKNIYQAWEKSGLFNPDNLDTDGESFTISMPPPNATGILHMGHASRITYEDLMTRYHRLRGKKALYLPGTDHAAIATQTKVEKILAEEGTTREELGREKFLSRVREYVASSQNTIRNQLRKVGASCDWSRERYTLDEGLSHAVMTAFNKMYEDGLIYRGNRIVNWCPRCKSTLADDEVEYVERKTPFYYFKYGPVIIGTARPETKFGDKVIIVHPDDARYKDIVGKEMEVEWILGKIKAKVVADEAADMEMGSGAMTITPAHSFVDFELAQKHGLDIEDIIDKDGKMTEAAGEFAGLPVEEARKKVVEILQKKGLVEKIDDTYVHNLSVCYRCETPIQPLVSKQWFVAVDKEIPGRKKSLKKLASEAVKSGDIKILPNRFEKIYHHWMDNLHDWCISRQIWWGHRIPVWYTEDGEAIVAMDEADAKKKADGKKIKQDEDTLDTWFSSALWTFSTLGWPEDTEDLKKFHPTSVMETGYDIIFFWVARMILMSEYLMEERPFETVYLGGLIRDEEGRKMSKSLGNGVEPVEMIEKYGADAIRLSMVLGAGPGVDLRIYEQKIAGNRNFVNKLWNISRFIFGSVKQVKRAASRPAAKTKADQWILSEFDLLVEECTEHMESFRFSQAAESMFDFTWNKLADWYLEIAKIEGDKDEILLYILERLLILLHPFLPFVTESLWEQYNDDKFLMIQSWPKADKVDHKAISYFHEYQELVRGLRNLKAENKIAPKELPDCFIESSIIEPEDFAAIARLSRVTLATEKLEIDPINISSSKVWINLTKKMSQAELDKQAKYIKSLKAKLANENFVKNAAPQVVEETKQRLEIAQKNLEEQSK